MKCSYLNFSALSFTLTFTLYHYRANMGKNTATMADILTPGFFEPIKGWLNVGDMVHVAALDGGMTLYVAGVGDMRVMAKTVGAGG